MGTVIFSPDSTGLKPEDFWQYEAGFEHEIMNVFTYSASVYQIEAQNLLKTDPIDPLALKNSGFAIIRGVEGGAELKLSDYFKLGTSAAYNDPGSASAQTALLTGRHYASASFAKTFELRLEAEYALSRYDQDNRLGRLQDYTLWNAGIKYNTAVLGAAGSLYLDVDNILDTHYDVKAGYPAAGFLVRGGAIFKI
jgi:outer membrane cobalamin receptor